ncbi:hypothetical protein EB061_09645 [bacterium]|nr:hypothetical protein [bacterium]
MAGAPFNFTVTAKDASGNTATGYNGAVAISSSDIQADLPATASLTNGVGTFQAALKSAGSRTLTATDGFMTVQSGPVTVTPGAFSVSNSIVTAGNVSVKSGSTVSVTLTTKDAYGNLAPTGLPNASNISFNSSVVGGTGSFDMVTDAGSGVFTSVFTGQKAGAVSIGATISGAAVSTNATLNVTPGDASQILLTNVPTSATAGTPFNFTVTARDASNNVATGYTRTVNFTSTDALATLPAASSLINGVGNFTMTLNTSGSRTLTVGDGTLSATSNAITVNPSGATQLVLSSVPATTLAGNSFSVTVTAKDSGGNTATDFSGTVSITSNDGQATLPASSTLVNGVGTFSVILKTSGPRTLTASSGALTTTAGPISVGAGVYSAANSVVTASPASVNSGSNVTVTLTTKDAYGNLNPTGLPAIGAIAFTSSTIGGTGTYLGITNQGSGVYTESFRGVLAGSVSLGATISGVAIGTNANITVNPGAANSLTLSSVPPTATSGLAFSFTVTAKDPAGNTATGYSGTVSVVSSDAQAVLPPAASLTNGVGTFSVTLRTAGSRTIGANDGSLSVTSSSMLVAIRQTTKEKVYAAGTSRARGVTAFRFTWKVTDCCGSDESCRSGSARSSDHT